MHKDSKIEMTTLIQILEKLRVKKFDKEFRMTEEGITAGNQKFYEPEELKIIRTYRFEGDSDPADNAVLYVIEANDGLIGYTLDVYGADGNQYEGFDDFLRKIVVEEREEQQIFID